MTDGKDFVSTGREFIRDFQVLENSLLAAYDSLFLQAFPPMNNSLLDQSPFINAIREASLAEFEEVLENLYDKPGETYNVSISW